MSAFSSPPVHAFSQADVSERLHRLAAEWKQRSRHLSNSAKMAMIEPYQRIIGMGPPVVPLILEELRRAGPVVLGTGIDHRTESSAGRSHGKGASDGRGVGRLG